MSIFRLEGVFIGKDGSMGFRKCKKYIFRTRIYNNWIWIETVDGLKCPYGSLEKLFENWRITGFKKREEIF